VVCNFTPVPRLNSASAFLWRILAELLNSDSTDYAGSGMGNGGGVMAESKKSHGGHFP